MFLKKYYWVLECSQDFVSLYIWRNSATVRRYRYRPSDSINEPATAFKVNGRATTVVITSDGRAHTGQLLAERYLTKVIAGLAESNGSLLLRADCLYTGITLGPIAW